MLKFAQIVNEQTKQCSVGLGTSTDFYKSIGMTELDVEQGADGNWYLQGYAPNQSLGDFKVQKIQAFKYKRDSDEVAVIEYNNKTFDYDDKSRERMRIAEKALVDNNLTSQAWTCADNSSTELTVQDFKNINSLAAQRSGVLHVKYNELKDMVNVCITVDELEQVTW